MSHPQDLGLRAQIAAIAGGDLDRADLLEATLDRIGERDGTLNSTPVVMAEEARKMLASAPDGPLAGVPITIKDMYALPWRGARNGTPIEVIPPVASTIFGRLRDAGAVVVGVANQHEAGIGTTGTVSAYGRHANAWDTRRCPGGSSGGSATAVAARLVAGSLGSDSGGSTRLPASYCGVVGLKLTYGAVPYDGYTGRGSTFSAPGAFGRDAADARVLASVLLGRELEARGGQLRLGLVEDPFWSDAHAQVTAGCRAAIEAAGWRTKGVEIEHLEFVSAAGARLMAEIGLPPAAVVTAVSPPTRALMLALALLPAHFVPAADRVRAAVRRSLASVFADVDVIAWPTTPTTAPPLDNTTVQMASGPAPADVVNIRHAVLANLCGTPGINIPVGLDSSGLPIGLQLLAPWGAEALLLDAAEQVERATDRAHVDLVPPIAR